MKKGTLFIDFDGTIVKNDFPEIGKPIPHAFDVLKKLKEAGYKLGLWTCRENDGYKIDRQFLRDAVEYCKRHGVEFDTVNETHPDDEFREDKTKKRKPHFKYCIDDRNIGCPMKNGVIDWEEIGKMLL